MTTKELALRPMCSCGRFLELRNPPGGYTPEQQFCGVWYDHPQGQIGTFGFGHTSSVLYESKALQAQLAIQRASLTR